jgi:hypothetical protein
MGTGHEILMRLYLSPAPFPHLLHKQPLCSWDMFFALPNHVVLGGHHAHMWPLPTVIILWTVGSFLTQYSVDREGRRACLHGTLRITYTGVILPSVP